MVNVRLVSGGSWAATGTISYAPIGTCFLGATVNTTEAQAQVPQRTAGTFSNLFAQVTARTNTITVQLRKAGATQTTPSLTLSATGVFEDTTNTQSVAGTGDLWNYILSGGTETVSELALTFAATTNTVCRLNCYLVAGQSTAATFYNTLSGQIGSNSTVGTGETIFRKGGTLKNLAVYNTGTPNTGALIVTAKGATPTTGNCTVDIAASGSGLKEDTTHTDTVTAADLWTMETVIAGGGTQVLIRHDIDFVSTTGDSINITGFAGNAATVAISTTTYYSVGGGMETSTTESNKQVRPRDAFTVSNLGANITQNNIAATPSVSMWLELNTATTSALTVTWASATTGRVDDTTHTDTLTAANPISFKVTTGAGSAGQTCTIQGIQTWMSLAAAAPTFMQDAWVPKLMVVQQ